ncbi:MAG: hypothetical protein K2J95_12000 [Lachnospiraceae bacterium]|nr:hypothetical protein [Lachnospiraceae bacterium]
MKVNKNYLLWGHSCRPQGPQPGFFGGGGGGQNGQFPPPGGGGGEGLEQDGQDGPSGLPQWSGRLP